jgi:hypothetical protein
MAARALRSRRSPGAIGWGAVAVLTAVLAAGTLVGCGGDEAPPTTTTTTSTTTTFPPGPAPGAEPIGLRDVEIGTCFDPAEEQAATDRGVWAVDCTMPHRYEAYDVVDYGGPGADGGRFPGAEAVRAWSDATCFERFEDFVGLPWTRSIFQIAVWWPSEESWARSDRTVICAVFPGGARKVEGSQRGAAR